MLEHGSKLKHGRVIPCAVLVFPCPVKLLAITQIKITFFLYRADALMISRQEVGPDYRECISINNVDECLIECTELENERQLGKI